MENKQDPEDSGLPRERRLNMRLMAFWWDKRADRRFPSAEDFDPQELSDVWTHCFTIHPQDPYEQSAFDYVGDSIAAASGISGPEITVDKLGEKCLLDHATRNVGEVLTQQVPVIRSGEFVNEEGETVMFRSILLPLSQDQNTIDCVVGGARCKVKRPS
jgi:hypothetical protein